MPSRRHSGGRGGKKHRRRTAEKLQPADSTAPATPSYRLPLLGILAAALVLRSYKLLSLFPPLGDESIYMRWAEIIDNQRNWFISLLDGKPPLSYWALASLRIVHEGDPLLQARLASLALGVAATALIFALTRKLAGARAGLLAAGLYAVFPWALLYDRIGYTEAFVNFFGVLVAYAAVSAYQRESPSLKEGLLVGLALGLGLFTKQTVLLFALLPLAAALFYARGEFAKRLPSLAVCYLVSAAFFTANPLLTPEAPTLAGESAVLHQTGFFVDPAELLRDPLVSARSNAPKLLSYVGTYVTWPLALFALASAFLLRRSFAPWLLLAGSVLPLVAQVFTLEAMYPTRYPFPHFASWLIVAAIGAVELASRPAHRQNRAVLAVAAVVLAGPVLYRDARMLTAPEEGLHPADANGFLADSSFVGHGSLEAVALLQDQARSGGPFLLLTDPYWGPPADVLFAYLNGRYGIRAYEAWWLQLDQPQPVMPNGSAEVLRSDYERTSAGEIDFRQVPRVYYATDTHQMPRQAVRALQPGAQLIGSFPTPNGRDSIDVYRLR